MSAFNSANATKIVTPAQRTATTPSAAPAKGPKVSHQMCAVIAILSGDNGLYDAVSPFISLMADSIDWERIYGLNLCGGQRAMVDWAFICWRDEVPDGSKPFDAIWNCDEKFRKAILKGLAVRWGISR